MTDPAPAEEAAPAPTLAQQRNFWDSWNATWRAREVLDDFQRKQRAVAVELGFRLDLCEARILEVGCGTGWLSDSLRQFGHVSATDLSPAAIAIANEHQQGKRSSRWPPASFVCGDFLELDFPTGFDLIVSADTIAHVADQARFVTRVAELLRPGGAFLLMTQNPFVWNRSSRLQPRGHGQLRNWPSLGRIRELLQPDFRIEEISSIAPGGDRGLLFWVDRRRIHGAMDRVIGPNVWSGLLESALLGRELVVVARARENLA